MPIFCRSLLAAAVLAAAGCAPTRPGCPAPVFPHSALPGRQPDGSVLLPNQWSLRPAGAQVEMGDFPINVAVHPGGRTVLDAVQSAFALAPDALADSRAQ